jgi:hypothetical protein
VGGGPFVPVCPKKRQDDPAQEESAPGIEKSKMALTETFDDEVLIRSTFP